MAISKEEIAKVAKLSRLDLSAAEQEKLSAELSAVVDYFNKLNELDTSSVNLELSESENSNRTREDKPRESNIREKILENAPATEDGFIKVKSVL